MKPIVAIVGRPNVGKSILFNRIVGRKKAIVEDHPGVTRDRNYADIEWWDNPFSLIDTGGFEPISRERIFLQMKEQCQLAIEEADLILFVLDSALPFGKEDAAVWRRIARSGHGAASHGSRYRKPTAPEPAWQGWWGSARARRFLPGGPMAYIDCAS